MHPAAEEEEAGVGQRVETWWEALERGRAQGSL